MRNFNDWLMSYCDWASFTEAPRAMHFWSGVSAVAGALRRRVWLDMKSFRWFTNHYIILVAPPGIVSKTTTAGLSMNLLRGVPGINFGPDVVTWPALVTAFASSSESFDLGGGDWMAQCALTLESSEFGNLINPQDREMIDLLVTLWDAKQGAFNKKTKTSGSDTIENPWINMIACTTPAWIAGNFPEYVIGGGFTSRCLFVYAEKKEKRVAYPDEVSPPDFEDVKLKLIQDLEHISTLIGKFKITPEGRDWGRAWYENHYDHPPEALQDDRFGGYLARKQTHLHKLAMIMSAGRRDDLLITQDDLFMANKMITDLEESMPKVFAKIGRSEDSVQAERFIKHIIARGSIPYDEAYRFIHMHFPNFKEYESMLAGAIQSGQVKVVPSAQGAMIVPGRL